MSRLWEWAPGPDEPHAWRQWPYVWEGAAPGDCTLRTHDGDGHGIRQPDGDGWHCLGYGNNGVEEHAVTIEVV